MLQAVAAVVEHLTAGAWEEEADGIVSILGTAAGVERVSLFERRSDPDGTDFLPTHVWSREPGGDGPSAIRKASARWVRLLGSGQVLVPASGSTPWYGDRELERMGLDPSAVAPVVVGGDPLGFLAFDGRPASRPWTEDEVAGLRAAAASIAGAMRRAQRDLVLGELAERYRALVEEIPAITYIDRPDPTSPTGYRPVFFSPQSSTMLGYPPEELEGRPDRWMGLLHEDDREMALAADAAHHATGQPLIQEYRLVARDGRVVWVRDQALMVRDEAGRPKFSHGVLLDVTEQKRAEKELRDAIETVTKTDAQRRALLVRLVTAQEEERARVARNIHDDSIQLLASVSLHLEVLQVRIEGSEAREEIRRLTAMVRTAIAHLRDFLTELRPPLLDTDGLSAAIREVLDQLSGETGIRASLRSALEAEPPVEVAVIVYRIVQEALTNVKRHADASHVRVILSSDRQGVAVTVVDNGVGFDTAINGRPGHLGLASMRERAELAGGWFEVESVLDGGTTVRAWAPVGGQGSSVTPDV